MNNEQTVNQGMLKMVMQMQKKKEGCSLLTPQQVADMLGVTTKTLREWNIGHRHRKLLAPIRFTHKHVRYEFKNVQAFIDRCRTQY